MNWIKNYVAPMSLPSTLDDLWEQKHPEEDGLTFDEKLNDMLEANTWRKRLDRIFLLSTDKFKASAYDVNIVGDHSIENITYTINENTRPVFPSDHFGLLCEFDLHRADMKSVSEGTNA